MPCYHPMYGLRTGAKTVNGRDEIKILGSSPPVGYPPWQVVQIPCGRCIGCRLEYSRQWANRCMLELEYHDSAHFVTFTYDNDHVPISYSVNKDTGEASECMTLRKRDFQLLMKRIRKRFCEDTIRFYAAGEYGSTTFRPHYHAILFGLHLDDLQVYKATYGGNTLFNSESLSRAWLDSSGVPIGHVVVAPVTWETCAYVARYTAKKEGTYDNGVYELLGMEKPFTLMSRRPGIGRQYYDDHPDLYEYDSLHIKTKDGGRKIRPPRYFDRLLDKDDPAAMHEIKRKRINAASAAAAIKQAHTSVDPIDQRAIAERIKQAQLSSLRRDQI